MALKCFVSNTAQVKVQMHKYLVLPEQRVSKSEHKTLEKKLQNSTVSDISVAAAITF